MGPKVLAWNGLGGYSFPRTHPLEAVCFQTIKQEIQRIPILKLRLAVELLNKKASRMRCFFVVHFLPDRFWRACYVRKYKLNFRNREMRDNNGLLLRATSHLFRKFEEFP